MNPEQSYQWLKQHSVETAYLVSTAELAAWDQRTFIPAKGHAHRSEQMATLAKLIHERSTSCAIQEHLEMVEGTSFLEQNSPEILANVRMWRQDYDKQIKIPASLAFELAQSSSIGESAWEASVQDNDWETFKPHLKKLVDLSKQKAEALGYPNEPYDALLDEYEIGATADFIEDMFQNIKDPLIELVQKIKDSSVKDDQTILNGHFPVSKQRALVEKLVSLIGFSLDEGRIDESMHPFSVGIGPGDSRITTRYNEDYIGTGVFGCLHEAGHSLYELGLRQEHFGTPAGMFVSLGIHESQSRMWENMVGRSNGFWRYVKPIFDSYFPLTKKVSLDNMMLAINQVRPGFIRVEADEVTYNLHVLIRFELELMLFRNQLDVDDLPDAWNDKMQTYLGIRPTTMKQGVMQDVHWSAGMFGYFPTYTLGNLYSAQLFNGAREQLGDLEEQFSKGDFSSFLQWLRHHVHHVGQMRTPAQIVEDATQCAPDSRFFVDYCIKKYSALYNL